MAAQSRSLARGEQEFALAEVPAGACDDTSSDEADSEGVVEGEEEEEPWRAERSRAEPRALAKSGKEHDVATCKAEKDSSQTQLSVPTVGCLAHIASGPCRVRDAGPYLDLEDDEDEGASSASSSTNSPARGEVGEDFREEQRAEEQNYQVQKQLIWVQHKEAERRRRFEEEAVELLAESREMMRVLSEPNARIDRHSVEEEFKRAPQQSSGRQPALRGRARADNVLQLASKLGIKVPFLSKTKRGGTFSTLGPAAQGGTCV